MNADYNQFLYTGFACTHGRLFWAKTSCKDPFIIGEFYVETSHGVFCVAGLKQIEEFIRWCRDGKVT